jgi:predicted DsbA family dithiol-disulfide isomerase
MSAIDFESRDAAMCGPNGCDPNGCTPDEAVSDTSTRYSNAGVGQVVRLPSARAPAPAAGRKKKPLIEIDVHSDVLCPWCYYGKRGLDVAMAKAADRFDFLVRWHPFFIRPNIPRAGRTPAEAGIGSVDRPYFHYMKARVARDYPGLLNMTGKCSRYPNTTLAHSLLLWALHTDASKQHALMEAVFAAFYAENRFVGSVPVLLELAAQAGFSPAQVEAARIWLETGAGEDTVRAQAERAARNGLSGVPDFSLSVEGGGRTELHGGAHWSAFLSAFERVAR